MSAQFDDKIPIYLQIMDLIKGDIILGKIEGGDKLPSVRELASELKVNPNTLQRAYQELEREKITYTQRGMGTFVTTDKGVLSSMKKEMAKSVIDNFIDGMRKLGFDSDEIITAVTEEVNNFEKGN